MASWYYEDRLKHRCAGECAAMVRLTTLDVVLKDLVRPVSVMKIDIEGLEFQALKGASAF